MVEDAADIGAAAADADDADVDAVVRADDAPAHFGAASRGKCGVGDAERKSDSAGGFQEISTIHEFRSDMETLPIGICIGFQCSSC